jgi:hypothetical protein
MSSAVKKQIVMWICILYSYVSYTQSGIYNVGGATLLARAHAGSTSRDINAMYTNIAGIAEISNFAVDGSYSRRFGLEDLSQTSVSIVKTLRIGSIGLALSNFGFTAYNEQKIGLAYARKLGKSVNIGGQFDLLRLNQQNLGSATIYTFEIGAQYRVYKQVLVGTHIFSPGTVRWSDETDIGSRYTTGVQYMPSDKIALVFEVSKIVYKPTEIKVAATYKVSPAVTINMGANPLTQIYGLGLSFDWNDRYHLSAATSSHQRLGYTPAFSLQYVQP